MKSNAKAIKRNKKLNEEEKSIKNRKKNLK